MFGFLSMKNVVLNGFVIHELVPIGTIKWWHIMSSVNDKKSVTLIFVFANLLSL